MGASLEEQFIDAARRGDLAAIDSLLQRGVDVNMRESGDNTYAMHWAAAAGHLDVVRRLADAGGDVVGEGDDHQLEVIGWATCWQEASDDAHRAVAEFLVSRGARHHIYSAIALELSDEVRRIVAREPAALNARMSRNEDHQTPLHFAVRMQKPGMVRLLIELGADPLVVDGSGESVANYATDPQTDLPIMRAIAGLTAGELLSAERGQRAASLGRMDMIAALALGDFDSAGRLAKAEPSLLAGDSGVLHLMSKRGAAGAVRWLLSHGVDPNARWPHWDAVVTPIHLASAQGHVDVVRALLDEGGDPDARDSKHDGDAIGWAEYGRVPRSPSADAVIALLRRGRER